MAGRCRAIGKLTLNNTNHSGAFLGAISSTSHAYPEISGSAVLLILGLYEDICIFFVTFSFFLAVFPVVVLWELWDWPKFYCCFTDVSDFSVFYSRSHLGSGRTLSRRDQPGSVLAAVCGV